MPHRGRPQVPLPGLPPGDVLLRHARGLTYGTIRRAGPLGTIDSGKRAGAPALGPLTLSVAKGEALAVTGPSGSGKSTLLNLVAGLDKPTDGSVTVAGRRIDRLSEHALAKFRRGHIGMAFQFFNLLDDLTVLDSIQLPAQLTGTGRRQAAARARELMEMLGIAKHARAYPGRLSGGERQRSASHAL